MYNNRMMLSAIVAFIVLIMAGCASSGGKSVSKRPLDRAVERWGHLIERKGELAYDYLSPGARSQINRDTYASDIAVRPVRWTAVAPESENCSSEDVCEVKVTISFKVRMPVQGVGDVESKQLVTEKWLRTDGQWYFVPDA